MGHAERLRRLVTMGVLSQLGMSLECCSEGSSFWDDPEDPARTPARAGSHAASQLPCLSRRSDGDSPVPRCLVFRRRLMRHADTLGPASSYSATSSVGRRQVRVAARPLQVG